MVEMRTEFTATQQVRIAFLVGRYATAEEIAADHTINATAAEIRFAVDRMDLPAPPHPDAKANLRIELDRSLVAELDRCANARKIGRCDMAERIVAVTLESQMVGAVMDDGLT